MPATRRRRGGAAAAVAACAALLPPPAAAPSRRREPAPKRSPMEILKDLDPNTQLTDLTDEQREAYDSTSGNRKCKACDDMVERVEEQMKKVDEGMIPRVSRPGDPDSEKRKNRMKRAAAEARAIEILETICHRQAEQTLYCQQALEMLEDKLTAYIVQGEVKDKVDICDDMCEWKVGIKTQIKDMQSGFMEQVKNEELKKRLEKEGKDVEGKITGTKDTSIAEQVLAIMKRYWWIYAGIIGVMVVITIWIRCWLTPRVERAHREMMERERERRAAAAKDGGADAGGAARRRGKAAHGGD